MKRTLGIILALVLVLGALFVPVTFSASAANEGLGNGNYYKFDFSESAIYAYDDDAARYDTAPTAKYGDYTFVPSHIVRPASDAAADNHIGGYWTANGGLSVKHGTYSGKDALEIKAGAGYSAITLVDKDGTPFIMKPGTKYHVEYTIAHNLANNGWIHLGVGGIDREWTVREGGYPQNVGTGVNAAGTNVTGNISRVVATGINGTTNNLGGEPVEKTATATITTPESFSVATKELVYTDDTKSATKIVDGSTYNINPFLQLYVAGSNADLDDPAIVYITDLVVYEDGYVPPTPNPVSIDYIETSNFTGVGRYPSNGSAIYYPGVETTVTKGPNQYIGSWGNAATFSWNDVEKCYEFEKYYAGGTASNGDIVIPAKGFMIGFHVGSGSDTDTLLQAAYERMLLVESACKNAKTGDNVYLYGIDFYENYLDTSLEASIYTNCKNQTAHYTQEGYASNARVVFDAPLETGTPFNPEQENIALETLQASVLKGEAFLENGEVQALRVYSGYTLNKFDKVFYNGAYKEIVARGIIYTPTTKYSADTFKVENVNNSDVFGSEIVLNETTDCWLYDEATNTTVFSNYFINYTEEMYKDTTGKYSMTFASYIVLDDGTTVVSPATTFDVNEIMVASGEFDSVL